MTIQMYIYIYLNFILFSFVVVMCFHSYASEETTTSGPYCCVSFHIQNLARSVGPCTQISAEPIRAPQISDQTLFQLLVFKKLMLGSFYVAWGTEWEKK